MAGTHLPFQVDALKEEKKEGKKLQRETGRIMKAAENFGGEMEINYYYSIYYTIYHFIIKYLLYTPAFLYCFQ